MNILDKIVANTRSKLEDKKLKESLDDLLSKIDMDNLGKSIFKKSLEGKSESIIAEIKKASPSAGLISKDFNPVLKAKENIVLDKAKCINFANKNKMFISVK